MSYGRNGGNWTLVQRDGSSQIIVPETPTSNDNATSKKYVDDNLNNKLDKVTGKSTFGRAYVVTAEGSQELRNYGPYAGSFSFVQRDGFSQIQVPETPTDIGHATSKSYVDTGLNNKLDKVTTSSNFWRAYVVASDGRQELHNFGPDPSTGPWTLVERDGDSQVRVPITPKYDDDATSKKYVDKMTTGTATMFTSSSSISTGAKNGESFSCQGGTKGVYAVNTSQFVGIIVITGASAGLMYGQVISQITPGQSIDGHKLI